MSCDHPLNPSGLHRCTLCGDDIAPENDAMGEPGWSHGHNVAPLGNSASITGKLGMSNERCCYPCSQSRVLPRRIKIARFAEKLSQAASTPFEAIALRDALVEELVFRGDTELMKSALNAEIAVWEPGLIQAALRGKESFVGQRLNLRPIMGCQLIAAGAWCALLFARQNDVELWEFGVSTPRWPIAVQHHVIPQGSTLTAESLGGDLGVWLNVVAMQAFMDIEVIQRESARLPRQARRLMEREGKPVPSVIVVRLRRIFSERGAVSGETDIQWRHRWLVRGHWRRQWYATKGQHETIYIASFIKGPEGKPFMPQRPIIKRVDR